MLNAKCSIQFQFEQWFVFVWKVIKEMLPFSAIMVSLTIFACIVKENFFFQYLNFTHFLLFLTINFAGKSPCRVDKGFVRDINGNCVCPPGSGVDVYGNCVICRPEEGFRVDETGRCVCAIERGFSYDERGRCKCPVEHGYIITPLGECVPTEPRTPGCETDKDCEDHEFCEPKSRRCEDACLFKGCGINALCNATNHVAICQCIAGYTGNPDIQCSKCYSLCISFN